MENYGTLFRPGGEVLRPATKQELARSLRAALNDNGEGLIDVDGVRCRVTSPFTNDDIKALMKAAQERRDLEVVDWCRDTLDGDTQSRIHCELALLAEHMSQDD